MKKKIISILIVVMFLSLFAFGVYKFVSSFKEDQALTTAKMKQILNYYDKFNISVLNFAEARDYFYEQRQQTFIEEFSRNVEGWNILIENYEKKITEVEKNSKFLKKNCQVKFADPNVSSKCTIFKSTYEGAMNYFISDIKNYNKNVEEYNEWAKNNNKLQLNKGNLVVYKKYIDFDNDKQYFGKEEVKYAK